MDKKTLPDGWLVKPMTEVVTWSSGGTPKATEKSYYENGTIPWLVIGDLNDGLVTKAQTKITDAGLTNSNAKMIPPNTLLVAMYGSIGKLGVTGMPCCTNQAIAYAKELHGVTTKYMFYYLSLMKPTLISLGKGGTQKNISLTVLKSLNVTVPPFDEQFRIVAHIEELFSELDKAVDTLKTTKEQLTVYRQAVLKEIFDSVSTTSVHIKDVCLDIKVGIVIKPTQYYVSENGVPAFRNANVRRGYINDTDWVMISKEGHQQNCRSEVHTNDVLISRSGANLGMASVVPARYNGYNAIDVVIAVPDMSKVIPEFLAQYTNSPMGRAIVKKNERGAAQGHLNVSAYANLPIGVPDLQEQEKLVKQISDRLSVCDSIEKTVDTALAQADAMRQSILKQAFEAEKKV